MRQLYEGECLSCRVSVIVRKDLGTQLYMGGVAVKGAQVAGKRGIGLKEKRTGNGRLFCFLFDHLAESRERFLLRQTRCAYVQSKCVLYFVLQQVHIHIAYLIDTFSEKKKK